ncbi:4-hydroxy-tetrahydrodipicolinate synthase [Winogradskyella aurantiaca]|uniref:4-hydroxy-tetrahydrodipicolinate synthase n=1 Tax=Winogradskyella aurantiaca TaxID=2219558 RepID=UPI000E1CAAA0|nr:4-hydroxy-tetrahydrodipicolinate synthase [Winogradskyella aurantiaca]
MTSFKGTGVALVTPFDSDLKVDYKALERLVNHNIENGAEYLVISGTTGESATIGFDEKKEIVAFISKINAGRLPLVLGIGGNNTAMVIKEIQESDLSQIDAILSVSPYYSKPTQEGIYKHFEAIASATEKPVILYNVPGRTGSNVLPSTILRLAESHKNIIGVKEAAGNMAQYYELLANKPEEFLVISGDDDLALSVTLAGGAGVISVIGQAMTRDFTNMIRFGLKNDALSGTKLHLKLKELTSLIFTENNPAGVKALLQQLEICSDKVRLPLVPASEELKSKLSKAINRL